MSAFNISDFEENAVEKLLKQYALLMDSLLSDSKRVVDFGDYAGMTFSQVYSEDYVYCRQLLRLKPKTITMLRLQGYIQKINFIYKPETLQICEQYSSFKSNMSNKMTAITNKIN
jgi:hypothetical protein